MLADSGIAIKGLFMMNANAGIDSTIFRQICAEKEIIANIAPNPRNSENAIQSDDYQCFDEELYEERYVIQRANAWQDGFKALIMRYERKADHWNALIVLSFCLIFMRTIQKKM
jgi:hypothetical protein